MTAIVTISRDDGTTYDLKELRHTVRDQIKVAINQGRTSGVVQFHGSRFTWTLRRLQATW